MYILKKEYEDTILTITGRHFILKDIKSEQVEVLKLEKYFTKKSKKTKKTVSSVSS